MSHAIEKPQVIIYSGDDECRDEKYEQAVGLMVLTGRASTSFLQRKLRIGSYLKAVRLMQRAEDDGIVTRPNFVGRRDVIARPKSAD